MSLQKLYHVESPLSKIQGLHAGANSAYGTALSGKLKEAQMQPPEPPKKTIGGGMMAGLGGALTAASMGSAITESGNEELGEQMGGGMGMGIMGGLGALAYFLGG